MGTRTCFPKVSFITAGMITYQVYVFLLLIPYALSVVCSSISFGWLVNFNFNTSYSNNILTRPGFTFLYNCGAQTSFVHHHHDGHVLCVLMQIISIPDAVEQVHSLHGNSTAIDKKNLEVQLMDIAGILVELGLVKSLTRYYKCPSQKTVLLLRIDDAQ